MHDEPVPFDQHVAAARQAYEQRDWSTARAAFVAADAEGALGAADLEAWGLTAFLTGDDAESDAVRQRAHFAYLADDDPHAAARVAFWLGLALTLRGEPARGGGWFGRMTRVVADAGIADSVWSGYELLTLGMRAMFSGAHADALDLLGRSLSVADRFGDLDLRLLGSNGRGQTRVAAGDLAGGLAELDEMMVLATTSDVSPQAVGLVTCAMLTACHECLDVRRSLEWTQFLTDWCDAQPGLVPYRGQCTVHRAELLQLRGHWDGAVAEIQQLLTRFATSPADQAAGMAHYQRGELYRVCGAFDEADGEYREALRRGRDPQPGLALLRLAQGRADVALVAVRRALDEVTRTPPRIPLLRAAVEIAIAAGDATYAHQCAEDLAQLGATVDSPFLLAAARFCDGALALFDARPQQALITLREALTGWLAIDAPYEAARCRVLIAQACNALGDTETAELELSTARATFETLCDENESARLLAATVPSSAGTRAPESAPQGLTPREVEVLRLVATGATNRDIAETLFLSEKTVARHVANIFGKISVSSRAAATAYAYEQRLA